MEPLATNPDELGGVTWVQLGQGSQPVIATATIPQTIASKAVIARPSKAGANNEASLVRVMPMHQPHPERLIQFERNG
jgi:hypothetical protein